MSATLHDAPTASEATAETERLQQAAVHYEVAPAPAASTQASP